MLSYYSGAISNASIKISISDNTFYLAILIILKNFFIP